MTILDIAREALALDAAKTQVEWTHEPVGSHYVVQGERRIIVHSSADARCIAFAVTHLRALAERVIALEAVAEAARGIARKLERGHIDHPGDWACAECVPHSDMLRAGFQCSEHALVAAIDALSALDPTPTQEAK